MPKQETRSDNYYEFGNGLLTSSKLKDYKKDPEFFYKKHISGEIEQKITDPMIIGSAVDCWISEGKDVFDKKYVVFEGVNRNKKDPNIRYHLTMTMYEQVRKIAEKVEKQPAYKDMKDFECQKVLKKKMDLGKDFFTLAGIPDWVRIDGDTCNIVDYKTAQTANKYKYHYVCLDLGYYFQQAMYQYLVELLYPEVKNFVSKHLITVKDPDEIYNSYTRILSQGQIEQEKDNLRELIEEVRSENFHPYETTWDDIDIIGETKEEAEERMDESFMDI